MKTVKILSPYNQAIVGEMPESESQDIESAIQRSQAAFQVMRKLPRFVRADILMRAAEGLKARREEFARRGVQSNL